MKKIEKIIYLFVLTLLTVTFSSCDGVDTEKDGRDAGKAFCNCLDNGNTMEECEEDLKSEYNKSTYTNSDFKKGFDEAGKSCGVEWQITRW